VHRFYPPGKIMHILISSREETAHEESDVHQDDATNGESESSLRKPKGWLPAFESDELFARSFPFWLKNSLNDGMVGSSTFPAEAAIVFADSSELFVFSNS